jgi:Recombination endonuclease VII
MTTKPKHSTNKTTAKKTARKPKKTDRVWRGKATTENSIFTRDDIRAQAAHVHENMSPDRAAELWDEYGISPAIYQALWFRQGGKCAICERVPAGGWFNAELVVDHDHAVALDRGRSPVKPFAIRGLLCTDCNKRLTTAAAYAITEGRKLPKALQGVDMSEWVAKAHRYLTAFRQDASPLFAIWPELGSSMGPAGRLLLGHRRFVGYRKRLHRTKVGGPDGTGYTYWTDDPVYTHIATEAEEAIWMNLPDPVLDGTAVVRALKEPDGRE